MKSYWHNFFVLIALSWMSWMSQPVLGGNCPIIFLHGHESNPTSEEGWKTWRHPLSAMNIILDCGYGGYTAGNPLECNENSVLKQTGGETRKIYNFSYYCADGDSGAIGSNGILRCSKVIDLRDKTWKLRESVPPEYALDAYGNLVNNNSWAEKLAVFIDKVLGATGAEKVDVVAHSMGGLVVRAAIKWYEMPCGEPVRKRVRKLITIGTPNSSLRELRVEIKLSVEKELPDAGGHLDLAGVRVMFRSYSGLYSRGTLSAVGTETDSIRFMPHIKEGDHQKIRLKGIGRWLKC